MTKLIFFEGMPGSGKTTSGRFVKELLDKNNISCTFYNEGHDSHPIYDYFSVYGEEGYKQLSDNCSEYKDEIENSTVQISEFYFLRKLKLKLKSTGKIPDCILDNKNNIWNKIPIDIALQFQIEMWKKFISDKENSNDISLFECCLMQDPIEDMLAHNNADESYISNYILELFKIFNNLNPLVIYLCKGDVRKTILGTIEERDESWSIRVTPQIGDSKYCKERGMNGLEGWLTYQEVSDKVQKDILALNECDYEIIDLSDGDINRSQNEIRKCVESYIKTELKV